MQTYFIISPGVELNSYIHYPDDKQGCYVKFGDEQESPGEVGIRKAYLTHNPDIGVAAVMESSAFKNPYLGTRLKQYLESLQYYPVETAPEWFSIDVKKAWALFNEMRKWDAVKIDNSNLGALNGDIKKHL